MMFPRCKTFVYLVLILFLILNTAVLSQENNSESEPELKKVIIHSEKNSKIPSDFALHQNYPNPFNPSTTIDFSLPVSATVYLKIFNILGGELDTIVQGEFKAGNHQVTYTPHNLPSGIYFYRIEVKTTLAGLKNSFVETKRFVLQK